jgi:Zn-dependent metalloprotease
MWMVILFMAASQSAYSQDLSIIKPVELKQAGNNTSMSLCLFLNLDSTYSFLHYSTEQSSDGTYHQRYKQHYRGFPVEDAVVIIHQLPNGTSKLSGNLFRIDDKENTKSLIPISTGSSFMRYGNIHEIETVYYRDPGESKHRLVHKFTYTQNDDLLPFRAFADVESGRLIISGPHTCWLDHPCTAHTRYHGTRVIDVTPIPSGYELRSTNRGQGINTRNLNHQLSYSQVTSFFHPDTIWEQPVLLSEKNATDAHFCATSYYDFLYQKFGRNSLDNHGYPLNSYLNYGNGLVNAFWNGTAAVFGSGNAGTGPLTTLDITGHEFTHGLIQKTAGLQYSGEPGIIHEALADMLGTALEYHTTPSEFNWTIGEKSGNIFRSMENPNLYNQPKFFHGSYWYYGTGDNGGVHINSGFLNYWFYLLVNGGSGVNEKGWDYQVQGTGMDQGTQLIYHTLIAYLTPSTTFEEFVDHTIQSASDLWGPCSPQYLSVCEAWKATGLQKPLERTLHLSSTLSSICPGQSAWLMSNPLPGSALIWKRNGILINHTNDSHLLILEGGTYQVSENRCGQWTGSQPVEVSQLSAPVVSVSSHQSCSGIPVNLSVSPAGGTLSVSNPYMGPSTSYNYTVSNTEGCTATAHGDIIVMPQPIAFISPVPGKIPENSAPIKLEGNTTGNFTGPGVVNGYFDPLLAGEGGPYVIRFTVTNNSGCEAEDSVRIYVDPPCTKAADHLSWEVLPVMGDNIFSVKSKGDLYDLRIDIIYYEGLRVILSQGDSMMLVKITTSNPKIHVIWVNSCGDKLSQQIHLNNFITLSSGGSSIYPNPVTDSKVTIRVSENLSIPVLVSLIDPKGKVVRQNKVNERESVLNLNGVARGSYSITISDHLMTESRKITIE